MFMFTNTEESVVRLEARSAGIISPQGEDYVSDSFALNIREQA
jgi:hypothetical protein